MTTNICTPSQYYAIEKIVQEIEQSCPTCQSRNANRFINGLASSGCTHCGGSGTIHPYTSMDDWLKKHGKERLYRYYAFESTEPVLHVADALDLLEEAGAWESKGNGRLLQVNNPAELLDEMLATIEWIKMSYVCAAGVRQRKKHESIC